MNAIMPTLVSQSSDTQHSASQPSGNRASVAEAPNTLSTHARTTVKGLEDQITELAAHISAATWRLLTLIREYDLRSGWNCGGTRSCAHWLNWKCGIAIGAAREKVRVAHALAGLPKISAAFREGRLSYSKVRAMTRIASPENEDYLLMVARHGTASHMERLVSSYRRVGRRQAREHLDRRELQLYRSSDGSWIVRGRLTAEQGERLQQALDAAAEDLPRDEDEAPPMRRADAHHVVHWADGGATKLDNLVLLCRYHHRLVHEGGYGVTLNPAGEARFRHPDGSRISSGPDARFRGNALSLWARHKLARLNIGPTTLPPDWRGESMDLGMAVDSLLAREGPAGKHPAAHDS